MKSSIFRNLTLCALFLSGQVIYAGYNHVLVNHAPFEVFYSMDYHTAFCSNEDNKVLHAGEAVNYPVGICTISNIVVWGGNSQQAIATQGQGKVAKWPHDFTGDSTWEITWNDNSKQLSINQTNSNVLGIGNQVVAGLQTAVNETVKLYGKAIDAVTFGKAKEGAQQLNDIANTVEKLPADIKKQTQDINTMPDQLRTAKSDVEANINDINKNLTDIKTQRENVNNQKLKEKGVVELSQLNDQLLEGFNELEKFLTQLLATLNEFKGALTKSISDAENGKNNINGNIGQLDGRINSPSSGYPSLPARIRKIGSILKP